MSAVSPNPDWSPSGSVVPSEAAVLQRVEAVQRADSALDLLQATQALAATAHPAAAACLVEVLGFNNPGAAVAAVDGLIAIGVPAVGTILTNIDGYNYGARAWAVRALARIGEVPRLQVVPSQHPHLPTTLLLTNVCVTD